jgi:hypothetical protein
VYKLAPVLAHDDVFMWDSALYINEMLGADLVKIKISLVFAMLLIAGKSKGKSALTFFIRHSLADQTVFFKHVLQAAQSLTDA